VNLFGDVELFGRNHTLFFGADYAKLPSERRYHYADGYIGADTGFSILDPDYSLLAPRYLLVGDYPYLILSTTRLEMMGVSAQAILRPAERLQVILGARYSEDEIQSRSGEPLGPVQTTKADAVTTQAGITYGITKDINLYASYGETYEPNRFGQRTADGNLIDPEEGESNEIGAKGELFSRRLLWTLAFFDVERSGIAGRDPFNPGFSIPIGTQRSRGVEFDVRGEVVPGWDVFLSVASLDAEFIDGDADGMRPVNAPEFGVSLFTNYEIQGGVLRGLGFGIGAVHKSGREADNIYIPGVFFGKDIFDDFTEVDLSVFYSRDRWRFDVDVTNVTGELYYSNAFGWWGSGFNPNAPRAVKGRVTYSF
jgi:iron complex outermembrane receptor protein